MQAAGF
jgi:hypothetical protein